MGKIAALLLILVFLTASCLTMVKPAFGVAEDENSWVSKASMGWARGYLGVAAVNGKIYAIGGDQGQLMGNLGNALGITHEVIDTNEEYDPILDKWVRKSPMPTARARFGITAYQNKIYCIGGYNDELDEVGANEVYDPATNTWEIKASLPTPLFTPAVNVVGGRIYVMGGYPNSVVEVYDPETDTWATRTAPPLEVWGFTSAVVDSKIFVLGEEVIDPVLYRVGYRVQIYDPANDSWTIRSIAPSIPFSCAIATSGLNALKRIYFFDETSNDVYDPSNDSWSVGSPAPTHRPLADAVAIDDLIYVIGGRTGQWGYMVDMKPSTANEQYTPFGYGAPDPTIDRTAPTIVVLSPESKTYYHINVTLDFMVNETISRLSYSLDGQSNVTVTGNTTLNGLLVGVHNVTVYAWDTAGNGASETIIFTIAKPEASPVMYVAVASVIVALVVIGLIAHFKKRKH